MTRLEGSVVAARYVLLRLIGRGAMGIVYEARHVETHKRCALKLLSAKSAGNPSSVSRFFREARASGVVESDHIVKVFDAGLDSDGHPFLVMEYLVGEDLEATIGRLGAIHPQAALKIGLQTAIGLAKAHAIGIVHRDVKPANLFLTESDTGLVVTKILDFGVAKMRSFEASAGATNGQCVGTLLFMSPEQCQGDGELDARSDLWSLGVVLWEMLTGSSPFRAPNLAAVMARITQAPLPSLRQHAPWVGSPIADIVDKALERDRARRWQSAGELAEALFKVTDGAHFAAPELRSVPRELKTATPGPFSIDETAALPAQPGNKRKRVGLAVIVAGSALAGTLASLTWDRATESGARPATDVHASSPVSPVMMPSSALAPALSAGAPATPAAPASADPAPVPSPRAKARAPWKRNEANVEVAAVASAAPKNSRIHATGLFLVSEGDFKKTLAPRAKEPSHALPDPGLPSGQ